MTSNEKLEIIRNDIVRDMEFMGECAIMYEEAYSDMMGLMSVMIYKILTGYVVSVVKEKMLDKIDFILEQCSYSFYEIKLDRYFENFIMDYEQDIISHNIDFLETLSFFGWEVTQYYNLEIIEKMFDPYDDYPKEAADLIQSKMNMVMDDSVIYGGCLDLFVLQNKDVGYYFGYAKMYPNKRNPLLHELIIRTVNYLSIPLYSWYNEDIFLKENGYYSVLATGSYGDYDTYTGLNGMISGCFLIAYYLQQLLRLAEELLPGYLEYKENLNYNVK